MSSEPKRKPIAGAGPDRLNLYLQQYRIRQDLERQAVEIARDTGTDVPPTANPRAAPGDRKRLRGIPALAPGVSGEMDDTQPEKWLQRYLTDEEIARIRKRAPRLEAERQQRLYAVASRRRARLKNAPVVERVDRIAIIERDKSTCHICGEYAELKDIHLDHVIPLAKGGSHTTENLKVAHSWCNSRKGDRLISDECG